MHVVVTLVDLNRDHFSLFITCDSSLQAALRTCSDCIYAVGKFKSWQLYYVESV